MPDWKAEVRQRLAGLQLEPTRENSMVEELAQHLEEFYEALLSSGATSAEAHQQTLAELSSSELPAQEPRRVERQIKQEASIPGTNIRSNMIADLWQDLRYGARMLLKKPGFTTVTVLALGLVGGLLGAAMVARMLTAQLYGVQPFDAVTLLVASFFLVSAGLLATWWPARQAAAKNPVASLNEN